MYERIQCDVELKSVANNFFDKFANSIEQDNGPKQFRIIIDARISDPYYIDQTLIIL